MERWAVMYLTGVTNPKVTRQLTSAANRRQFGLLIQPDSYGHSAVAPFAVWAADNGCFAKGDAFDTEAWLAWLASIPPAVRKTCAFATAPDVVGDAEATLARSMPWLRKIRALGYPAAFVAQDGSEQDMTHLIPWDECDVIFLGGSTEWKLDPNRAGRVAAEALRRGKRLHMGRVNSARRLRLAEAWGCHTVDGTFLAFGPDRNLPRLLGWMRQRGLFAAQEEVA